MQRVVRVRLLAGLGLAGAALLLALGHVGAGVGVLTVAVAALLLVVDREAPAGLAGAAAQGALAGVAHLLAALELQGRGIVVPGAAPEEPSRLFVPAREARPDELPPLQPGHVLHRQGPGALGVLIDPPGAALEARWRAEEGLPQGRGAEEAAHHVRRALGALGLGRDVVVARAQDVLRVAYVPLELAGACRASREELAPLHVQAGCPACSFVAILVARAHGRRVRLADAGVDGQRVYLDLEVG